MALDSDEGAGATPPHGQREVDRRRRESGEGGLMRCRVDGDGASTNLAEGAEKVESIAADDTHVYWIDAGQRTIARRPRATP